MDDKHKFHAICDYCAGKICDTDCDICLLCKSIKGDFQKHPDEMNEAYAIISNTDLEKPDSNEPVNDPVNHPAHYTKGGIECLDAIRASMTDSGYLDFLKGQVIKYIWRYQHKGKPLEDLQKAEFYLKRMIELIGQEQKGGEKV